jgi:hypothetical protein
MARIGRSTVNDIKISMLLVVALVAASCSDSGSGPSGATTAIAVTLPSVLRVGETAQATAIATTSGGAGKPLSVGWKSDSPLVATVNNTGLVSGLSNGLANIFIDADGVAGTKSLRVVPDYQGQWAGGFTTSAATPFPSDAYQHMCAGYVPPTTLLLTMTLTQTGQSVNGQFIVTGLVSSSFVSLVDGDGGINIRASNTTNPFQYDFTWRMTAPVTSGTFGFVRGTVSIVRTGSAGLIGGCNIEASATLNKTSG